MNSSHSFILAHVVWCMIESYGDDDEEEEENDESDDDDDDDGENDGGDGKWLH